MGEIIARLLGIGLLTLCIYDQYEKKITNEEIAKNAQNFDVQIQGIKNSLKTKKFLKPTDKIFSKNENLEKDIAKIFSDLNMKHIMFKEDSKNTFEIKFQVTDELKIYELTNKLRSDLNGIVLIDNIDIESRDKVLHVQIKFRILYPQSSLKSEILIKRIPKNPLVDIFGLTQKKYQLNGVLHYSKAYINGQEFGVGDSVGEYKIQKIFDSFIILQKDGNLQKVKLNDSW